MKRIYFNHISKFILAVVLGIFLTLAHVNMVNAQIIRYVKTSPGGSGNGSSWANASNNLQAMINASASGDQVWVAAGTYKPTSGTDRTISFSMKNGVSIFGGFIGTEAILAQRNPSVNVTNLSGDLNGNDVISGWGSSLSIANNGENSYHVVNNSFSQGAPLDASALLDGFTIRGGCCQESLLGSYNAGAGIFNVFASPTLNNLVFTGNHAEYGGGGLMNSLNCSSSLTNVIFIQNSSQNNGGAMYNYNGANVSLTNVRFEGNFCYGDFGGGGICNFNNTISLTNCHFNGNFAPAGGAVTTVGGNGTFMNCSFANSGVFQDGGCMWVEGSTLNFTNCFFSGSRSGLYAGVFYNKSSNISIKNSTFYDNASGTGANYPPYNQSSVMAIDGSNPVTTMTNCILWGNQSLFNNNSPTISYSVVQGGWSGPGSNNLNTDPRFVNSSGPLGADGVGGTADDGLRLQSCSPAVNTGNNTGVSSTDLVGNPRIYNSIVDMGPYELQALPSSVVTVSPFTTDNALRFDGVNDYVELSTCGTSAPMVNGGSAITIEYWFKGSSNQSAVRLQSDGSTYVVAGWNGNHILSNDGGSGNGISAGNAATDGNWHHVAMTWQQNTVNGFKSYLDGQLVAQRTSANTPLPVISGGYCLGAYLGSTEFMNGRLDQVRIWSVSRTQQEIQAGMCGLTLPQAGLIAFYTFNHGVAGGTNSGIMGLGNIAGSYYNGQLHNFDLSGTVSNWVSADYISTYYADSDGDGYGNAAISLVSCQQPAGYVANNTDCNDANSARNPGATEVANGADDNCNGQIDEGTSIAPVALVNGPTTFCQGGSVDLTVATGDNALQLNGLNQYMITPDLKSLFPSTSMTIELWFMANAAGVVATELGQQVINDQWHDSQIEVLSNGHVMVKVWPLLAVDLGTIAFGTWHHAVVRYNEASQILDGALDGVPSSSSASGAREVASAQYWAFGPVDGTNMGSGAWLSGQIDEIRIWNRAVSNAQIQQNYQHIIPANSGSLVAYYKLDETSGTSAYDATANAKHATLVNTPAWVIPSGKPVTGSILWSNGATTRSINVTSSGNYTATVTVSAGCTGTTAPVAVNVTTIPNVSPNDFGQNVWIVYAWNAGGASSTGGTSWNTNFSGYYTDPNLDFNSATLWDINGSPSSASGFTGCAVGVDNYSFSAKRQGFPCGYYRLDVPGHDDEAQLWINGTMVWNHDGCCDAHTGVWTGWLGVTDKVDFRITEGTGQCYGHLAFTLLDGIVSPITTGNALNFDGIDDHVAISPCGSETPLVNGGDAITIEYWFRGSNAQSAVRLQSDGNNYIVAAHQNSMHILSNDGGGAGLSAGEGFNDGNWHHMAFSWQRNTVNGFKSFLDGQLVDQRNSSDNPLPVISAGLYIGSLFGNLQMMQGSLDEVRIWNVARTQGQIQAGMCSLSLPQSGLLLYYSFDHGTAGGSNAEINTVGNLAQPGVFNGRLSNFTMNGYSSNLVEGSVREGIDLQGGSPAITIANGDLTPGLADNTEFGSVADGSSLNHTFTIRNTGGVRLDIGSISITGAGSAYFSATSVSPASPVPGFGSASFTVTFLPTMIGLQTAIVHVPFSECNTGEYTFAIQGTGTCAIPAPEFRTVQNITVSNTTQFEALNTVTVAGSGSNVTVAPGGIATFIAGIKVRFLPGTTVQQGGHLHGYIETGTICGTPAPSSPIVVAGEQVPQPGTGMDGYLLYPNPTGGKFTLVKRNAITSGNVAVEIYGMYGERLQKESMTGENRHDFDLSGIPAGLYFVKIESAEHSETIKLVKTR